MTSYSKNMIADPKLRIKRKQEKQYLVLRFLRESLWSTQDTLQLVMGLSTRQATHKSLKQMEQLGLIKNHVFDAVGGKLTVWGITAAGQAMAFDVHSEMPYFVYFEPSRVSEQLLRHQIDLQKLRLIAERNGWSSWQDGDRLGLVGSQSKRPDAVSLSPKGKKVAIECERSFKTIKRYEQILLQYLKMIKNKEIEQVVWLSPTLDFSKRLELLIKSIKSLNVGGQKINLDPSKHFLNLFFCSYQDWPNHEL